MSYGCKNRAPLRSGVFVREPGSYGAMVDRELPMRMAPDCQYTLSDLGKVDQRCDGCKHRAEDKQQ